MTGFRKLSERRIWEGHVIEVAVGCFTDPDGGEFERELVHHPGAVSVVPYLGEQRSVVLLRQYRASIDAELLEIPAGKLDVEGEPPEATARRELEEEVGLRAGHMEKLAEFYNSPGFSDEHSVVYLAQELERCHTDLQGVEEEHMTVEHVPLEDVPRLIASGQITDAKTIIGLSLAREALA
ncbi:MAG TPA: NUDIX hydrolase [Acidimicrobiales bacterium]|nr:NUDIX hydrolase [Acidimicrobiales bacterium]